MSHAITEILDLLDLERLEQNLFRGRPPQAHWQRVFGGQVIGQALIAACRTVEGRQPHSLHGYFLLPGDPRIPIIYEVDRLRDGRSFATRRVLAIQHGHPIFALTASFQVDEPGFDHATAMPDVPPPESLPEIVAYTRLIASMPESVRAWYERDRPLEVRPVDLERRFGPAPDRGAGFTIWVRATGALPDDPDIHRAVLAYASDLTLLDTALVPHGRSVMEATIQAASLDHAMWFHRPFRADEWLLFVQETPSTAGARGYARALVYNQSGHLLASVAQEGVVRNARLPA